MKTISIGKILITIVALMTTFGSYIFDWNATHIFNSNWPPHARFHNAQTMLLGTMMGLLVLWLLWMDKSDRPAKLGITITIASFYWLGQIGATLFPGTALVDPEFAYPGQLPAQLIVDLVMLTMLGAAYWLERRKEFLHR